MADQISRIVWVDTETTGLDHKARMLEVACVITDLDFNEIAEPFSEVIWAPRRVVRNLVPRVRDMHTASGLIQEINSARRLRDVETALLHYIQTYVPDRRTAPMGGSSIHMDFIWMSNNMPRVMDYLHYRLVDVSTVMQLANSWFPELVGGGSPKVGNHRALADIRDSIATLRYYRENAFR